MSEGIGGYPPPYGWESQQDDTGSHETERTTQKDWSMSEEFNLLPCPFCALSPEVVGSCVEGFTVICMSCGGEGGSDHSFTRAVGLWNARPAIAETPND